MRQALLALSLLSVLVCMFLVEPVWDSPPPMPEVALAPQFHRVPLVGGVSGDVVVTAVIGKDGTIVKATVESGHIALHEDALEAAKGWKFAASAAGVEVRLVFSFHSLPASSGEGDAVLFYPPSRVEVRQKRPQPPDPYP